MTKYLITPSPLIRKREDITGRKYNFLTAIKFVRRDKSRYYWLFKCDCENEKIIDKYEVKSGHTKSCGCKTVELCRKASITHGNTTKISRSKEYSAWAAIIGRCYYKKHNRYHNYSGRGIKVCDRWRNSFENFLADMGKKPEGKSLDRIDNNGDYEPSNCRWVDCYEQANNRTSNVKIEYCGEVDTVANWCRRLNVTRYLYESRVKYGWSLERIFTTPKRKLCRKNS